MQTQADNLRPISRFFVELTLLWDDCHFKFIQLNSLNAPVADKLEMCGLSTLRAETANKLLDTMPISRKSTSSINGMFIAFRPIETKYSFINQSFDR